MGLDALRNIAGYPDGQGVAPRELLELRAGNRQEDWEEFVNVRLQNDGPYWFWKKRGGSTLQDSVFGNIITLQHLQTTIGGSQKDYIAIHTAAGHLYLWEKDSATAPNQLFSATFSTTQQIDILINGTNIYIFDFDLGLAKVYDLDKSISYDWVGDLSDSITGYSWITGDFTEDNIWGFAKGERMGVFHKYADGVYEDPETRQQSFKSFAATIEKVYANYLAYSDPAGETVNSNDGSTGLFPATPDLEDLLGVNSILKFPQTKAQGIIEVISVEATNDTEFIVKVDGIRVPEIGSITALSTDSAIDVANKIVTALQGSTDVSNLYNVSSIDEAVFIDAITPGSAFADRPIAAEILSVNPGNLVITTLDTRISSGYVANGDYGEPILYRGYLVVDLLTDGSFAFPGRPITVLSTITDIATGPRIGVALTMPAAAPQVAQRYIYATRWQTSEKNVHTPSRPKYDNSAFFLVRQVDTSQTTVKDFTPDSDLLTPLSSDLPLAGGALTMFGPGQLVPASVGSLEGALMIGGYTVNRPIPAPYTDPSNPAEGNAFINILGGGTALPENYQISFVFEYSDGRQSNLVLSGVNLTDGELSVAPGQAAVAPECVTTLTRPSTGGVTFGISYDGHTTSVTLASGDTAAQSAQKVASAINNDVDAQMTAAVENTNDIRYTSKDVGTVDNGKTVSHPTSTLNIDFNPRFPAMAGGDDGTGSETVSGNQLQIHSLNTLVRKVYVLAKDGINATYFLLEEIGIDSGKFHGQTIYLPNVSADVAAKDTFTASGSVREIQDLFDYVVPAVPFQQPLIDQQAPIKGQSRIKEIIPMEYDVDKTLLRYRLAVFTDQNLQIGYITSGEAGIDSRFEVVGEGVILNHRYGAWKTGLGIVFQDKEGIYLLGDSGLSKIIDRREYPATGQLMQRAVYNADWGEYWLIFSGSSNIGLVYDPNDPTGNASVRTISYAGLGALRAAVYAVDRLIIGLGTDLYYTDLDAAFDDGGSVISAEMITDHIGGPNQQTKILEVDVAGQGYDVQLAADMQKSRLERDVSAWDPSVFTEDYLSAIESLDISGRSFQLHRRGVMPKLKIKLSGVADGFVSHATVKYLTFDNRGKARQ